MAKLSASKIAIQDYKQKLNPVIPEDKSLTPGIENPEKDAAKAAYKSYLTTPVQTPAVGAEGVTGETISNVKEAYKKGGLLPAVLQGLGGLLKLANTSAGQSIIAGLSAPTQTTVTGARGVKETVAAPYSSMAWLQEAGKTREQEQGLKQGAISQELQRIKSLGEYGVEATKQTGETERTQTEIKAAQDLEDQKAQNDLFMKQLELEAQAAGQELDAKMKEAQITKINAEVESLKGKPAEEQKQTLAGILGKLAEKNLITPDDVKKVLAMPAEDIGKITISAPSGGILGSLFRNLGIGRAKVKIPIIDKVEETQ